MKRHQSLPWWKRPGQCLREAGLRSEMHSHRTGCLQERWLECRSVRSGSWPVFLSVRIFHRCIDGPFQAGGFPGQKSIYSAEFEIGTNALATQTVPAIIQFYQHQRANSPEELKADEHLILYGSTNTVDLRGGWC